MEEQDQQNIVKWQKLPQTNKKRNSIIDFLRIVMMYFVVFHHFCLFSLKNFIGQSSPLINNIIIYFGIYVGYLCNAIFIILIGYYAKRNFSSKHVIKICELAIGYYIIFELLNSIVNSNFNLTQMISNFFSFDTYWFIKSYIIYMIISPLLIRFTDKISKINFQALIIIIIICIKIIPTCCFLLNDSILENVLSNIFGFNCLSYFPCLLLGIYIKKYNFNYKKYYIVLFVIGILFTIYLYTHNNMNLYIDKIHTADYVFHFTAIYNGYYIVKLIISIPSKINSKISNLSACVIGIYLIHENPLIRKILWNEYFSFSHFDQTNVIYFIFLIPLLIFLICLTIEKIRIHLKNYIYK